MTKNNHWQKNGVTVTQRAKLLKQSPGVIWFTGLSGSGKSTTAQALEQALYLKGHATYLLDGDIIRQGLCSDLSFSETDRCENIRRVGEVAKLMADAGLIVIASFISPFRRERDLVRKMLAPQSFVEVYMNAPLSVCESRDPKGLYGKARQGLIENFTGISSPYEPPNNPEVSINSNESRVEDSVQTIMSHLLAHGD